MSKSLAVLIISLGAAATAQASTGGGSGWFSPPPPPHHVVNHDPVKPTAAPEIDPASALGAFTLLAGGLAVIRGRRRSK